jgi:hypothetical protein
MQFEEANSTMHHVNSSCIPSSKVTISNNDGVHCKTHHGCAASAMNCKGTRAASVGVWLRAMGATVVAMDDHGQAVVDGPDLISARSPKRCPELPLVPTCAQAGGLDERAVVSALRPLW